MRKQQQRRIKNPLFRELDNKTFYGLLDLKKRLAKEEKANAKNRG